ncbi:MAG: YceI family protein [Candidatus Flexifilum sp.]|jgi:polyisoprenoid-binding protein YceI
MATWTFDPTHSAANFSTRHMMITTVRGSFSRLSGTIEYDPANPAAASVSAEIDAASINTGVADRDNHLKSPDFLDVANHPTIAFRSTRIELTGETTAKIHGDLTIRGVTRPVVLEAELLGMGVDPFAKVEKAGFSARTRINREDWGLTWNMALEAGGWLVGKEIAIELEVEAVKVGEAAPA